MYTYTLSDIVNKTILDDEEQDFYTMYGDDSLDDFDMDYLPPPSRSYMREEYYA